MFQIYELYADYALKNPFYSLEVLVKEVGPDRHLQGVEGVLQRVVGVELVDLEQKILIFEFMVWNSAREIGISTLSSSWSMPACLGSATTRNLTPVGVWEQYRRKVSVSSS